MISMFTNPAASETMCQTETWTQPDLVHLQHKLCSLDDSFYQELMNSFSIHNLILEVN